MSEQRRASARGSSSFLAVSLSFALLGGCAGSPPVKVPERKTPQRFSAESSGPSAASIAWREYFADPSLVSLIHEALEGNLDLRIALQRIELARAGVAASTGALLPQVDLSMGVGVRKFGLYTMDGAGNATTDITPGQRVPTHLPDYAVGLVSTWEIDLWGKLRSQRKSAVAQYLATVDGANLVITSIVADIATSYYELLALDHARDALRSAIERQQQALEVVRVQKDAGRGTELAVQQFDAQLADTRAFEQELTQLGVEIENRINLLLGRFPGPVSRSKGALFGVVPGTISAGVPSELLRNRPDIREAERLVEASQYDVAAARKAFYPSLTLSAGVGFQAFSPRYLFTTPESLVYNVAGGLVAPLINRAALKAQLSGATAAQVQAIHEYQRTILTAYAEVVNGLTNVKNTRQALSFKNEQRTALQRAVETADTLYRAGQATYLEVLLAQQNTLQADLELIETQKRERIATVVVYKALGGGWR
jgi:multidrug efflux system outer membrane protein